MAKLAARSADRRVIAKRIYDALCDCYPDKYIALIQPSEVADAAPLVRQPLGCWQKLRCGHPTYRTCCRAIRDSGCRATVPALIGAALMIFGFWLKARSEEQFLRIELGPESYAATAVACQ
jgi:hypothetical protein